MNEREIALLVHEALEESVERLPYRVTHRLAASRAAALARLPAETRPTGGARTAAPAAEAEFSGGAAPSLAWRIAAVVVPILVVAGGLAGIASWQGSQRADDIADIDVAVLVDDVPISAYADRGFGAFLRNAMKADDE